ncbi:hypothetical protein EDC04DRAFT_2601375 [Pisolithus marmoratus]|nr:hypothetical protein EDC04DRAFT_2601375 [Pisolithus marmoratus]
MICQAELNDSEDEDDAHINSGKCQIVNYFTQAKQSEGGIFPSAPRPYRTFATSCTAFHLGTDPTLTNMPIDNAAKIFKLDDLHSAIIDYLCCIQTDTDPSTHPTWKPGGAPTNDHIPFSHIQIWAKVHVQSIPYHIDEALEPSQALLTQPPTDTWPLGCYDSVIINTCQTSLWPHSGIKGHDIGQMWIIFLPVWPQWPHIIPDKLLIYIQKFKTVRSYILMDNNMDILCPLTVFVLMLI